MAGIYIHIPFCKQACHYCNFHFSTSLRRKSDLVTAIGREINLRLDFLPTKQLSSIYFGGGTPSLLEAEDLKLIFDALSRNYNWDESAEITLEANPDDITELTLAMWRDFGVNRLSIGIQSFHDTDLAYMNRAHNAIDAAKSLALALEYGFDNISIDLIYGSPTTTSQMWETNLKKVINTNPNHVSAYALTVESKTALAHHINKDPKLAPDPSHAASQFDAMVNAFLIAGYDHYEISNFAKPGHYAIHNTNYWRGVPYLGIGPSAHSYDGVSRYWNVSNNNQYIQAVEVGMLPVQTELLTDADRYNELVMTGLRTMWGVQVSSIENIDSRFLTHFLGLTKSIISSGKMVVKEGTNYVLTDSGKHFADRIASDLFWVED
jgi:oxygen-independent coproporphyrinogen-3 oxidase